MNKWLNTFGGFPKILEAVKCGGGETSNIIEWVKMPNFVVVILLWFAEGCGYIERVDKNWQITEEGNNRESLEGKRMNVGKQEKRQWSKKGTLGFVLVLSSMLFFVLAMAGIIGEEWSETTSILATGLFFVILAGGFVLGIKGIK